MRETDHADNMNNKYITEFTGTFFLVLTAMVTGNPLAIGSVLMVMVYMGGHISGGHYNPAVTLGVWIRGKLKPTAVVKYWISQLLGAVGAALMAKYLVGQEGTGNTGMDVVKSLVAEFVFTFALVSVVLNVTTSSKSAGNGYYGLAIGFIVFVGATAVGTISGGAFNPAVAMGACLFGAFSWAHLWIYLTANFLAAVVAAGVYQLMNPGEQ